MAIWALQAGLTRWQRVATLGDGGDQAASAVCWAPLTGRPTDVVAVGSGHMVSVWDVTMSTEGVQVCRWAVTSCTASAETADYEAAYSGASWLLALS